MALENRPEIIELEDDELPVIEFIKILDKNMCKESEIVAKRLEEILPTVPTAEVFTSTNSLFAGQSNSAGTSSVGDSTSSSCPGGTSGGPGSTNPPLGGFHGGPGAGFNGAFNSPRQGLQHGDRGGSLLEVGIGGLAGSLNSGAVGGFGGGGGHGGDSQDSGASDGGYSGTGLTAKQAGVGGGSFRNGIDCVGATGGSLFEQHQALKFDEAYNVTRARIGRCLIINNENFKNSRLHSKRIGTNIDCKNLCKLFENLGYMVNVTNDCTAVKILSDCSMFLFDPNMEKYDSCVICILSHGYKDCIIGSDSKGVKEREIFDLFNQPGCKLAGKPKLVIIQACKTAVKKRFFSWPFSPCLGENEADAHAVDSSTSEVDELVKLLREVNMSDEIKIREAAPDNHDLLIAYSTVPGQLSWRNRNNGSWFIQALVHVFRWKYDREHVADMLVMVKQILLKTFYNMQNPHTVSHLLKKFYFFQ